MLERALFKGYPKFTRNLLGANKHGRRESDTREPRLRFNDRLIDINNIFCLS